MWASGLRNPFSGDVDPVTGAILYRRCRAGRLGGNQRRHDPGRNFGWPTTEGDFNPATFPNFTNPFLCVLARRRAVRNHGRRVLQPGVWAVSGPVSGQVLLLGVLRRNDLASSIRITRQTSQMFASDIAFPMNIEFAADGSMYFVERGAGAGGDPGIGTGKIVKVQYAAQIAPQIVSQPSNELVSVGYDATFTVSAAGTPPLAYQWQRHNGSQFVDIAGATNSTLVLPDVSLADDGHRFACIVSNSFGSATSYVVDARCDDRHAAHAGHRFAASGASTAPETRFSSPVTRPTWKTRCCRHRVLRGKSTSITPRIFIRSCRRHQASPAASLRSPRTAKRRTTFGTACD